MNDASGSRSVNPNIYLDTITNAMLLATIGASASAFFRPFALLLPLIFPVITLLTAALLLHRRPAFYVGFMWWTWFLTPEIRRLVDLQVGYTEQSFVMLAPYLVTALALIKVIPNLAKLEHPYRAPLGFVGLALLYAYGIGLLNNGLMAATFDLLGWSVPIISGTYLLTHREHIGNFQLAIQRTFMWGLLVMGSYALIQYFLLPPWDGYWMDNSNLNSIGVSEPLGVRVFSTLNAPGPFAMVTMAGLLLIFADRSVVRVLGAAVGFAGFVLSAVRSAWGGWLVGLTVIVLSLPFLQRIRLVSTLFVLTLVVVPVVTLTPLAELFSQRLQTVTDLENDESFNDRVSLYTDISSFTANNPLGQGLGSTGVASSINNKNAEFGSLDSGIISLIYTFGILGTIYFVGGTCSLLLAAFARAARARNLRDSTYIGITAAALSQLVFSNAWSGIPGMVLWFFPCLFLACQLPQPRRQPLPKYQYTPKGPVRVFKL